MKRPLRPCSYPGCNALTTDGRCEKHKAAGRESTKEYNRKRYLVTGHLYGARWKRARLIHLAEHPLCAECERQGRIVAATVVDHIIPHRGDEVLFWDESNWESLCGSCNSRKAATEEGGFGNVKKPDKCDTKGLPTDAAHHWNG